MDFLNEVINQTLKNIYMFETDNKDLSKTYDIFLFRTNTKVTNSVHLLLSVHNYFLNSSALYI